MQGVKRPCIPALRVWALHQHQGYASPAPSPGPLATLAAAASGPALDADSGARSTPTLQFLACPIATFHELSQINFSIDETPCVFLVVLAELEAL